MHDWLSHLIESNDRLGKQIEEGIGYMNGHLQPDKDQVLVLNERSYRRLIDILTGAPLETTAIPEQAVERS